MNKTAAHDIVHQWYGGKSENCPAPGCAGTMTDSEVIAEAKKIALQNYKPRTNPMIPYDQRLQTYSQNPKVPAGSQGDEDPDEGSGEDEIDDEEKNMTEFSTEERKKLASQGKAMRDGSFPIVTAKDVENAVHDWGRAGSDPKVKAHIVSRAKSLGATDKLPENWEGSSKKMNEFTLQPLVDLLSFSEKGSTLPSVIKVIPVGSYNMNRYGKVNITKDKITEMAQHFNENIRAHTNKIGLPIDIEHGKTQYGDAAAGWLKKIEVRDDGGYGHVEWTSLGKKLLQEKIYKLYSPEFYFDYKDPQHGFELKNVMTGGGLVNKPMIKDDLNPIVNSENEAKNKGLTKVKDSDTLFLELSNNSVRTYQENMQLSEIIKKEKSARSSEEQAFLVEHKEELTLAEARKEGFVPTEKKEENSGLRLAEGEVAVSKDKFNALVKMAEAGVSANEKLRKAELKEEVKSLVFSEKGSKLPADQIDVAVDLLMSMSEEAATKYKAQLKALPEKQIFTENGNTNETTGTAATQDLETKIQKYMEDNKVDYATAASKVVAANPMLFQEYSENLPVARQER